jgi:FkbM family methyltransferase
LFTLASIPKRGTVELLGYRVSFPSDEALDFVFQELFVRNDYMFQADSETPSIIDCGSNIGMSILFFKLLYPRAKIIGFEPDPQTFSTLAKNISSNGLKDVDLYQCALGNAGPSVEFFQNAQSQGAMTMSTQRERMPGVAAILVDVQPLSQFVGGSVDLLKLDIEGAEHEVLRELADAGKLRNILRIHMEYHHHIYRDADELSSILQLLEQHHFGYQIRTGPTTRWPMERTFQDISVYCYQKNPVC